LIPVNVDDSTAGLSLPSLAAPAFASVAEGSETRCPSDRSAAHGSPPAKNGRDGRQEVIMAHNLIASDRVEGTVVRRSGGEKIGVIQRLMIDKVTGKVAYAILKFGGILGFGEQHFPVPWASLIYNLQHKAYEVDITEKQLRSAPSYAADQEFDWGDRSTEIAIHKIYRAPQYWE
jgi:hypothetical protein